MSSNTFAQADLGLNGIKLLYTAKRSIYVNKTLDQNIENLLGIV
jgi:hypothetical protein